MGRLPAQFGVAADTATPVHKLSDSASGDAPCPTRGPGRAGGEDLTYSSIVIRRFRTKDAAPLAHVFYRAVHEIARLHYSEEQVRAWAPAPPTHDQILAWAGDGRLLLVAVNEEDEPLAFADLEADGHIDHFFCHPNYAGSGLAERLYDSLESEARSSCVKLLYVEASEPARRFFLRRDFASRIGGTSSSEASRSTTSAWKSSFEALPGKQQKDPCLSLTGGPLMDTSSAG